MVILWLVLLAHEQEKTKAGKIYKTECRFIGVYTCAEMFIIGFVTVKDSEIT